MPENDPPDERIIDDELGGGPSSGGSWWDKAKRNDQHNKKQPDETTSLPADQVTQEDGTHNIVDLGVASTFHLQVKEAVTYIMDYSPRDNSLESSAELFGLTSNWGVWIDRQPVVNNASDSRLLVYSVQTASRKEAESVRNFLYHCLGLTPQADQSEKDQDPLGHRYVVISYLKPL